VLGNVEAVIGRRNEKPTASPVFISHQEKVTSKK
jgi:hypothetical protein